MSKNLNSSFRNWKNKAVKAMFPEIINPICFYEKKIFYFFLIIGLLGLEVLFAITLGYISVNMKILVIAHAVAVLSSSLFWTEPEKRSYDIKYTENITVAKLVIFNFARGVNFMWFILPLAAYVFLMTIALLFPIYYGFYLYSIHIFFMALFFYMKKNNKLFLYAVRNFADDVFTIILYVFTGFNIPYISMYGSGKIALNFGIARR